MTSTISLLPEDVINTILSYIHPDERLPLYATNKEWLNTNDKDGTKPTISSLTSMSLITYYGSYLNQHIVKKIITNGHAYDFYTNEIRLKIDSISQSIYGTVDDERYITEHKIDCILNRSITNKSLVSKYSILQLEDYAAYRYDIEPSEYVKHLRGLHKTTIHDIINKCCMYDNLNVIKAIFINTTIGRIDIDTLLIYGSINCLQYATRHTTCWIERCMTSKKDVNIHVNVMDHVINTWHLFSGWLSIYELIKSVNITDKHASQLYDKEALTNLSNVSECSLHILPFIVDKLNYNYRLKLYVKGDLLLQSPPLVNEHHGTPNMYELTVMIQNIETYRNILTPTYAPLLYPNEPLTANKVKHSAIEKHNNNPVKFIRHFNRLKHKWSGKITHPEIYKAIVTQHWSNNCEYEGPITMDMHALKFDPFIGNPLIGHATIEQLIATNYHGQPTVHEKKSIIQYDRDDIVKHFNITSLKYINSAYVYLKYGASKIDYRLCDNRSSISNYNNKFPDYNFDPNINMSREAARTFMDSQLFHLYFESASKNTQYTFRNFKKLTAIHIPLLIKSNTVTHYKNDKNHLLKLLASVTSPIQSLGIYIQQCNISILMLNRVTYNLVKREYNPFLVKTIDNYIINN